MDYYCITSKQLFSVLRLLPCLSLLRLSQLGISHVAPNMAEKESPCPSLKALGLEEVPINSLGIYVVIVSLPHLNEIKFENPGILPSSIYDTKDEDPEIPHDDQVPSDQDFGLPVVVPPGWLPTSYHHFELHSDSTICAISM